MSEKAKTPELWALWHPELGWLHEYEYQEDFRFDTHMFFFESEEKAKESSGYQFSDYTPIRIFPPQEAQL